MPRRPSLTALYHEGYADRLWYDDTRARLTDLYGPDADTMIGFLAATSPRANLRANVTKALTAYAEWLAADRVPRPDLFASAFPAHRSNLHRVTLGVPLSGPKVRAFHAALMGDPDAVVLDVWMIRLFDLPDRMTPLQYARATARITRLADRLGDQPRRVQAALWCAYKRHIGENTVTADYVTLLTERN